VRQRYRSLGEACFSEVWPLSLPVGSSPNSSVNRARLVLPARGADESSTSEPMAPLGMAPKTIRLLSRQQLTLRVREVACAPRLAVHF
jgi:hypothetical protein